MSQPSNERRLSSVCLILGSYVFVGGLTSFLGWASNRPFLTDWTGSGISIQPNAALCAASAGAGLILLGLGRRALAGIIGALSGLIGLATIFEYMSGIDLGIDARLMFGHEWGRRGVLSPGRMGPPGSVSWTLIGTAIVMAASGNAKARRVVPALAGFTCGLASLSLIGYLFDADLLHTLPRLTVIAFQTSTFVFATGLGLFAAVPEHGLAAIVKRDDAAGVMTRRLLLPILIVPLLLGWSRLVGEQIGLYDSAFGTAARTLSEILLLSAVVWWTINAIARLEDSRRKDRLALAVRDRLLGAVTDHAAVGLAIVDPEERYLYANRQYGTILGLPPPLIVGRRVEESLGAAYAKQIHPRLQRAFAGERVHYELALAGQEPSRPDRLFDVIYEPQSGETRVESVVMAITDITDRKAIERSLREQAHLLELAHDAIMLLEMDGTIVAWNYGATETYGYTAHESLGRVVRELLHTVYPQPVSEIYEIAERQGRWEGELEHTTKDGRRIVVASRWALQPASGGRPPRLMEINRDITQRKRMEAALHAKEAELKLITTTTPVILTRCRRDLRFLFVNDAAAALYGLKPSQMIGQSIAEIMSDEAFAGLRPLIDRVLKGEMVDFELEIPYPRAGLRWMRGNFMPERNAEGEVVGWIASATDITQRKRVEEKLRESERTERLLSEIGVLAAKLGVPEGLRVDDVIQSICEHVADEMAVSRCGFGHVDLAAGHVTVDAEARGNLPTLKGTYPVSEYAAHLLADGVAGRITSMEDGSTDPRTAERYERLYQPIGMRSSINVPLHRDGRWVAHFWVSSEHPRQWTESDIERTRRTAERVWLVVEQARVSMNLRDSEVRLARELAAAQHVQEVSSQLIQDADLDVQLRKILSASAAITGTDKGNIQLLDAATKCLRIVVNQGLSQRFLRHFAENGWDSGSEQAKDRGERVIIEDLTSHPKADQPGLEVLLDEGIRALQSTPIMGRDGRLLGMLSNHFRTAYRPPESELRYLDLLARMAADLIERKQVEEALREADRRKDEFLATLAHELRNPLAPIRNAVHLLRPQTIVDAEGRLAHEIIDRQLQHLVRLVDDLLEVSRITSGRIELRKQTVDFGSILASAVETVHDLIEASEHRLTVTLPPDPVTLEADPVRLTQVFANLLNNACKYTPPGGRIDVTVHPEGDQLVVGVKDSGAGIPPQMLDNVFNLFTQVDRSLERSTGGLGIGLHLVRRLIELHGGTVSAHSQGENQGSEFVVRLPAPAVKEAPVISSGGEELRDRPVSRRRILLVDDNHDSVESLAMLLEHEGHETQVGYDGRQALDKAASWRPDVVLLDIGLPVMNGYDACRAIRRLPSAKDIRIIALSGWGQEQDRAMAREAGFDEHLVKPVNITALMKLLDEPEPAQA